MWISWNAALEMRLNRVIGAHFLPTLKFYFVFSFYFMLNPVLILAFAELQTDMSDLTSDLNVTGIPYWDYKNFTFKILFPGQNDHPSLHKLMVFHSLVLVTSSLNQDSFMVIFRFFYGNFQTRRKTAVMQALDKFEHLIYNKHFLLSFIHSLESQSSFSMQDRVQLAALLMLTLQHKMDYATQ
jgi:plexin A